MIKINTDNIVSAVRALRPRYSAQFAADAVLGSLLPHPIDLSQEKNVEMFRVLRAHCMAAANLMGWPEPGPPTIPAPSREVLEAWAEEAYKCASLVRDGE